MNITSLFFGVTADLIGKTKLDLELENAIPVALFKLILKEK